MRADAYLVGMQDQSDGFSPVVPQRVLPSDGICNSLSSSVGALALLLHKSHQQD
jgi:hypothetical protein